MNRRQKKKLMHSVKQSWNSFTRAMRLKHNIPCHYSNDYVREYNRITATTSGGYNLVGSAGHYDIILSDEENRYEETMFKDREAHPIYDTIGSEILDNRYRTEYK